MSILHYEKDNQEQGFILIMALVYLFVITILVTSAFYSSLLQTKMSHYTYTYASAFQNAESALMAGEIAINGGELQGEGSVSSDAFYHFSLAPQSTCALIFYQVYATGLYAKAKVQLQSLFAVPKSPPVNPDECPNERFMRHRVFWLMI